MRTRGRLFLCITLAFVGAAGEARTQVPTRAVQVRSIPLDNQVGNPAALTGCPRFMITAADRSELRW